MSTKATLNATEARALLKVYPPKAVAYTSATGRPMDDEGNEIDPREAVPWTMALGPFGSWPCTVEDAEKDFAAHPKWYTGESFRLGYVVVHRQGWGYAAVEPAARA
jgi:hypothetical protein